MWFMGTCERFVTEGESCVPARSLNGMTISLRRADFADPRLSAFLQAHLDELRPTAPPESRHALDLGALRPCAAAASAG